MILRITVVKNKQNCAPFSGCYRPKYIQCHYSTCTLQICWAEIKEYCIVLYIVLLYIDCQDGRHEFEGMLPCNTTTHRFRKVETELSWHNGHH